MSSAPPPLGDATARPPPRDRLSALPDGVLHRVLRFLDARRAAGDLSQWRIYLLSRRWRRLWATSPYASLSDVHYSTSSGDALLLLHDVTRPLRWLSLDAAAMDDPGAFAHQRLWVRHALGCGLRVLQIFLRCDAAFQPPDGVFNSPTLEEITLSGISDDEVIAPETISLPRLKKLHLGSVRFADASVAEKLNAGCPALEHLSLSLSTLGSFKISSQTLKTLSVLDCRYEGNVQLDGMPSLVSAWVYVYPDGVKRLACGGYNLVEALANAEQLELLGFDAILQDTVERSADEGLQFSKLRSLVIGEVQVTDFYRPLAYFLRFAPNLASLVLDEVALEKWHFCETQEYWNVYSHAFGENNHSDKLKLVSVLPRGLERLRIRLLKDKDDDEIEVESHKMLCLLKEKAKPKVMVGVWLQVSKWHY
ncbi:unnamed protein product [Urochloa decumbens]|uniref:F-box/LRR-repeat protein 15/At3g58940/PEG3-like LRR domain-containing protein n=1 Tax=Urochloa decumbens TaxID=240449 RepID=A0ABC9A2K8_9POAL